MGSYDHWKTTNPDDEWLGPEPEDEPATKTPGQLRYEAFWDRQLPDNIEPTGWERLNPEIRAAWEDVARTAKEPER
jgi:hypothetical protein